VSAPLHAATAVRKLTRNNHGLCVGRVYFRLEPVIVYVDPYLAFHSLSCQMYCELRLGLTEIEVSTSARLETHHVPELAYSVKHAVQAFLVNVIRCAVSGRRESMNGIALLLTVDGYASPD